MDETPPERRTRWWQRYAVLEGVRGISLTHWIISFHTFRWTAAWACGRRIVQLTSHGNLGIHTCVMPTDSGAVRRAVVVKPRGRLT